MADLTNLEEDAINASIDNVIKLLDKSQFSSLKKEEIGNNLIKAKQGISKGEDYYIKREQNMKKDAMTRKILLILFFVSATLFIASQIGVEYFGILPWVSKWASNFFGLTVIIMMIVGSSFEEKRKYN